MSDDRTPYSPAEIRTYYATRVPGLQQTTAGEWRGPCPIHGGTRDSFGVHADTGEWYCHSECGRGGGILTLEAALQNTEDLAAAGKAIDEIVGRKRARRGRPPKEDWAAMIARIDTTYDYTDEAGELLFQVVRFRDPKDFRQRRPNGRGGWVWSVKDVRLVPFRLPQVLASPIVIIVEGEKDVLTLESLGLVGTCNPMGAGKWRKEFNEHFRDKRVAIIPDADTPGVAHAETVLRGLIGVAESVRVVELPGGAKDVTEWVEHMRRDSLDDQACRSALLTACRAAEVQTEAPPPPDDSALPEPPSDEDDGHEDKPSKINAVAIRILQRDKYLCDDAGAIYKYCGTHWKKTSILALRAEAFHEDGAKTTERRRSEVVGYIRAASHVARVDWRQIGPSEVPFVSGVLDVMTGKIRPHRPEDYLETVLPHRYDPEAQCPTWMQALETYWGADWDFKAKVAALQEFFGYVLLPHARYKTALVCQGDSDTGKSQIAYALRLLVGHENCSSVSVEDMDDSRKRVPLIGKMLNLLTELTSKAVVADGGFKTLISTEEPLLFDPKFEQPQLYIPTTKHVIICNDLPQVTDRSMGTYNRMLILKFGKILQKSDQDRDFQHKLAAEISGIARWAVEGARRLVGNGGQFTRVQESERLVIEYRESQNDVYAFAEDVCEIHPIDYYEPLTVVYERFLRWAGPAYRPTRAKFEKMLASAGFKTEKRSNASGKDVRVVVGLRIGDMLR